jgi:hypothetical protein
MPASYELCLHGHKAVIAEPFMIPNPYALPDTRTGISSHNGPNDLLSFRLQQKG